MPGTNGVGKKDRPSRFGASMGRAAGLLRQNGAAEIRKGRFRRTERHFEARSYIVEKRAIVRNVRFGGTPAIGNQSSHGEALAVALPHS